MVLKDGKIWPVTGSPGGARIIITVLQVILNMAEAATAPRVHHQWLPDERCDKEGIGLGHHPSAGGQGALKDTRSIMRDPDSGSLYGVLDPRLRDAATLGY